MICGIAKAQYANLNYKFNLAALSMIADKVVEICYCSEAPTIVIPFSSEHGDFVIEANLNETDSDN